MRVGQPYRPAHLDEPRPRPPLRHVRRLRRQAVAEVLHVRHSHRIRKEPEHRRVVGRIPDEHPARPFPGRIRRRAEFLGQHAPRRGQLVVIAEPAVDMDGAHLGAHAGRLHAPHDGVHRRSRQRRDVLAIIDGQVGDAAELVRRQRAARHGGEDLLRQRIEPRLPVRRRLADKDGLHLFRPGVMAHPERSVLPHHPIHRPHARDVVAPPRRPARHRNHLEAGGVQALQRRVGGGGQAAFCGERVVDVGEDADEVGTDQHGKFGQGEHGVIREDAQAAFRSAGAPIADPETNPA